MIKTYIFDIDNTLCNTWPTLKSNNSYPFTSRQKLPETFLSNGAIYIVDTEEFMKRYSFFTDKAIGFTMETSKSFDIDTQEDIDNIARLLPIDHR